MIRRMERKKHTIFDVKKIERILNKIFEKHDEILLAYLYGSYAQEKKQNSVM